MIYDCFTYAGEHDLMKIRMEEFMHLTTLQPVTHIIVEGKYTFTGKERLLSTRKEAEGYNHYWHVVDQEPFTDPWLNERRQRNVLLDVLKRFEPDDNDIIIISDVDEIPRAYAVQHYRPEFGLVALQMDMHYYYLNVFSEKNIWILPKIMPYSYLKERSPEDIRRGGFNYCLFNGGWHFSYQGGLETILRKFQSFSHQEAGVQAIAKREIIADKLSRLESLWGPQKLNISNMEELPWYVQQHQQELRHMIYKP